MNREKNDYFLQSLFNGEIGIGEAKITNDERYSSAFKAYIDACQEKRAFLSEPFNKIRFLRAREIDAEINRRRRDLEQYEFIHELLISLIYNKNTREEK